MTNPNDSTFAHWTPSGQQSGLTKREYFAVLAHQGLLASMGQSFRVTPNLSIECLADTAVEQADLLIAALNKEGQADG